MSRSSYLKSGTNCHISHNYKIEFCYFRNLKYWFQQLTRFSRKRTCHVQNYSFCVIPTVGRKTLWTRSVFWVLLSWYLRQTRGECGWSTRRFLKAALRLVVRTVVIAYDSRFQELFREAVERDVACRKSLTYVLKTHPPRAQRTCKFTAGKHVIHINEILLPRKKNTLSKHHYFFEINIYIFKSYPWQYQPF